MLPWLLCPLAAGPVLGLAWWLLAPTAAVRVVGGEGSDLVVVAPGRPELDAAQDGTLLLLVLVAGLVTGAAVALRSGSRPASTTLLAALGALLGSAVAVGLGQLLGPDSLTAQGASPTRDGADGSLTSPLLLHAPGVLLVWSLVALAVATAAHALAARRERRWP